MSTNEEFYETIKPIEKRIRFILTQPIFQITIKTAVKTQNITTLEKTTDSITIREFVAFLYEFVERIVSFKTYVNLLHLYYESSTGKSGDLEDWKSKLKVDVVPDCEIMMGLEDLCGVVINSFQRFFESYSSKDGFVSKDDNNFISKIKQNGDEEGLCYSIFFTHALTEFVTNIRLLEHYLGILCKKFDIPPKETTVFTENYKILKIELISSGLPGIGSFRGISDHKCLHVYNLIHNIMSAHISMMSAGISHAKTAKDKELEAFLQETKGIYNALELLMSIFPKIESK